MKNSKKQNATAKTNTNFSRIRKALDGMDTIVTSERERVYTYFPVWDRDERGERLSLWNQDEAGENLTFSEDAIEQAAIDGHSVTMTAEDGQEHVLGLFTLKAAML